MHAGRLILPAVAAMLALASAAAQEPDESENAAAREEFLLHLRHHFEDIHEVSMRFHRKDPSIKGLIVLRLTWQEGRLLRGEVVKDETGLWQEGKAVLEAIGRWRIPEIVQPSTFSVPLRIKLVGSDDPDFPESAVLTGLVRDSDGNPIPRARISLTPVQVAADRGVPAARSNREGIFVRTLIPPGVWRIECRLEDYETSTAPEVVLEAGVHKNLDFTLRRTRRQ